MGATLKTCIINSNNEVPSFTGSRRQYDGYPPIPRPPAQVGALRELYTTRMGWWTLSKR